MLGLLHEVGLEGGISALSIGSSIEWRTVSRT